MSILAVVGKQMRVLQWRSLVIDLDQQILRVEGAVVPASPAEFALLKLLICSRNIPMSKEVILATLFGPNHGRNPLQADVFVARLRRLLAVAGLTDAITTVAGRGYAVLDDHRSPSTVRALPRVDRVEAAA